MKHFRVDKMDNVKLTDEKRDGKGEHRAINLSERASKMFAMYGGEEKDVKLRFSKHLTGVVIDRFGRDIMMIPDGGKHFTVSVVVEISPQFFGWLLCGLGKGVKVVTPEIAEQMKKHVDGIAGMYEGIE
jgi:predicted DNA-binding transcriptional regulator YafY